MPTPRQPKPAPPAPAPLRARLADDPRRRIAVLRATRTRAEPDQSLTLPLAAQARALRSQQRSMGAAGSAFARLVPEKIQTACTLVSMARGVLTVRCDDAATRFELDRWLRSGGELELIKATPTTLARVRVSVGAPNAASRRV